jgi:hypothetical protein
MREHKKLLQSELRLKSYEGLKLKDCQDLVPWVPRAVGYGPKFWIRSVPSSSKHQGNQTPHTRFGPTTHD